MRGGWVFAALLFAIGAALAADPTWPAPCALEYACVLQNDPAIGTVTAVEWRAGGNLCERVEAHQNKRGRWVVRLWHWPHPGDGCWEPGAQKDYDERPCNRSNPDAAEACGEWSNAVAYGPLDWACWDATCEVPCAPGLPLRFPKREGCP